MQRKKYFPMFDYLRFACCLLIFLYHYDGICGFGLRINKSRTLDFIIRNGNEAITLFFMLSGFCMACRYRELIEKRRISFGSYAWGHYSKFLTMILVTMPITIIKSICMYKAGLDTMPNLFGFILDLFGIRTGYGIHSSFGYNGPLWFINVLFLMYILYYFVVYVSKGQTGYVVVCLTLALFAVSQQAIGTIAVFVLNANCYVGIAGFFIGTLLYEIYDYYSSSPAAMTRICILCTAFTVSVWSGIYFNLHFPGIGVLPDDSNLWVNYSLVLTLIYWPSRILVMSQIQYSKKVRKLAGLLSKLSTSIYIWHWPIIYILYSLTLMNKVKWSMGSRMSNMLACGLTFGIAVISAFFFETRLQAGIRKFFRKDSSSLENL